MAPVELTIAGDASDQALQYQDSGKSRNGHETLDDDQSSEASEAVDGSGEDAFQEALSGLGLEELQEMGRRLTKCHMGLLEMLEEFEAEQVELKAENASLHRRISVVMKDVHTLDLTQASGAESSPERRRSLASVGRFWDSVRLKPGDAAVVAEVGQQAAQRLQEALVPLRQGATDFWNATGMNGMVAKETAPPKESHPEPKDKVRVAGEHQTLESAKDVVPSENTDLAPPVPAAQGGYAPAKRKIPAPVVDIVIVEAQVKIADGSSHTLHVHMVDSCEAAARRFIHDHSQRAWFQEPLTEWLKRAETDAQTLPAKVEGDLAGMRKEYSRRK
eukprot:CAMPEP_0117491502 /NCGR_PEP_ID=MMETSP0784-20121206/18100_1 /TAXON_ID=39447 /ORGANISM="" /LENGTH=331 /DNA_ID=CAMNT_0005286295 /DNA_START=76 /DNA_END=1071 /DNA_ORIENTATION=-